MRQGDRRGTDLDLYDYTYDGSILSVGNRLVGGLGQLTDGEEGLSNFRLDPSSTGRRGYEWIGWKSDSFPASHAVEIDFRFDATRNFSSVTIHTGNVFSKDVRVFRSLKAMVEVDDRWINDDDGARSSLPVTEIIDWLRLSDPIEFDYERDDVVEYPRYVTVPLRHAIGRRVVMKLYFETRWIMISEIQFVSGVCCR